VNYENISPGLDLIIYHAQNEDQYNESEIIKNEKIFQYYEVSNQILTE